VKEVRMRIIELSTTRRSEIVEITGEVQGVVSSTGVREGVVIVQSLHTTAGVTINENADPDVLRDLVAKLDELVPREEPYYRHAEGNSDSHMKASLFGPSVTVIVSGGTLLLGTWQGVYFCEWDGPRRQRKVAVQVVGAG
jgi:secondary thiamine-phosphate synthase enzyme